MEPVETSSVESDPGSIEAGSKRRDGLLLFLFGVLWSAAVAWGTLQSFRWGLGYLLIQIPLGAIGVTAMVWGWQAYRRESPLKSKPAPEPVGEVQPDA